MSGAKKGDRNRTWDEQQVQRSAIRSKARERCLRWHLRWAGGKSSLPNKGGKQTENAWETARRCAGGEAREGCESKRECTRSQARALSPNFIRRMPYLPLCSRRATGTRRKVCDYVNMISMCVKQFARATGSRVPDDSHAQQWAGGHVTTPNGFFLTDAGHAKTALECSEPH